ncbi:dual specificity protein phosphatase 1 [Amborella trichopoda]|uniref:Uncharacterized protein n=1 Tax=Amborella trichopoda TaxID=13333 RepID=W1PW54_AMBTC|nr:dual specificity protein phosphatase 1 [Amborella trichopoda]ERN12348.1 hypothetical protein AMTR_s00025p00081070 [Amborella trichopoda]|eukprot:XP_006850767.1 dual specificity protein phosphatase 1 [Amborella trichopoda]
MAEFDEMYRQKIATFLRAFYSARFARDDNVPCEIEPGLYLGSIGVAFNKDALKQRNITHILTVAKSLDPAYPNEFICKKIEVLDNPDTNIEQYFDECISFIEDARKAGGGVLVHCFAGRSRSVTIIVAYLMKVRSMSLSDALDLVRSKRPQIAPNHGFLLQLQKFERSLQEKRDAKD